MNLLKTLDIEVKKSKGLVHFSEALKFMEERVELIAQGKAKPMIWFLQHQDVYTAGISAKDEDLIAKNNIEVFKTNRGGKYTYHGPGMLIVYVMLDLKQLFAPEMVDVRKFVEFLENLIIDILAQYNIKGQLRPGRIGIWVEDENNVEKKIAALGIKLRKWVSYHGMAINIDPDLSKFDNIVPCGIKEFGVTSMVQYLDRKLDVDEIIDSFLLKIRG